MDQTTFFPFRCPACDGRARVASKHAGQLIVCPHCQATAAAVPDPRPLTSQPGPGRSEGQGNPITTSRIAKPFDPTTTASFRRTRVDEHFGGETPRGATSPGAPGTPGSGPLGSGTGASGNSPSSDLRPAVAPGTSALRRTSVTLTQGAGATPALGSSPAAATQTGTASVNRTTTMRALPPPLPPPKPSQVPFICAGLSALLFAGLAGWAIFEVSDYRARWQTASQQANEATQGQARAQAAASDLERRVAQLQTELTAAKAATTREREVTAELQKTNGRLAEELVRAAQAQAPTLSATPGPGTLPAVLASGTFPAPVVPAAGVPARREGSELK